MLIRTRSTLCMPKPDTGLPTRDTGLRTRDTGLPKGGTVSVHPDLVNAICSLRPCGRGRASLTGMSGDRRFNQTKTQTN